MTDVAALYVDPAGIYAQLVGDCWGEDRDARRYPGPWPVVAHPPCARWSILAPLVESQGGAAVGDEGGCFAAALAAVRQWGGVLEHPRLSFAWAAHGLTRPRFGSWHPCAGGGWVTEVSQAAYGHRAEKLTWLYCSGVEPVALDWSRPAATARVSECNGRSRHPAERMSRQERRSTPEAFARTLIDLALGEGAKTRAQLPLFE